MPKGYDRPGEELTPTEKFLVGSRGETVFRLWQNTHYQYRQGLFEESEFDASLATWCRTRIMYSADFVEQLESLLPNDAC